MADQTRQRGFLTLTIDDAKEYFKTEPDTRNRQRSRPITLCGLQWKLEAYREVADGVAWLGVYVVSSNEQAETWKCKATCVIRVRSSLPDDKTIKFCDVFTEDDSQWGPVDSLTIQDLLKPANGYVKNGKIAIMCSITASLPPQCEALEGLRGTKRQCTDVKVIVGDRHAYVNKGILAVSCKFFDDLFFGDVAASKKDQIVLEHVSYDDFTQFLKVMYPPYEPIDGDNIASVMPLADRFGARFILEKCEHFIFREMEVADAIPILDKCRLSDLKQQLLESASSSELIALADDAVLETLGRDTMASILKEHRRRSSQP